MNRLAKMSFILFSGLLLAAGVAVPASAHTQLIGVDPAEGEAVAANSAVTLTFSGDLLAIGAEVTVTDSAGVATALEVTFPTTSSAHVVLPVMEGGDLTLAWRVVAGDGHPVEGTLAYVADAPVQATAQATMQPSTQPLAEPSPSQAASITASEEPVEASPSAVPSTVEGRSFGINRVGLWVAIFAAVFGSSVAIVAAKRRR